MSESFDDHVAIGKIDRAPEKVVSPYVDPVAKAEDKVFGMDNPSEFEMAVARAKFNPGAWLYVDQELMRYLMRGASDKSLVYHGVRLYVQGSKEELDKEENMNAETLHNYRAVKARELNG
jgi:hypothetical protein